MKKTVMLLTVLVLSLMLCTAAADTLTLPDAVTEVGEEAFMGDVSIEAAVLPEGVEVIGDRAFLDCPGLREIHLPVSLWSIGEDAFPLQTVIWCERDSYAAQYAVENGYEYRYEKHYAIGDIWVSDEFAAYVQVTTGDACALRVDILDTDKQTVLFTGTADCGESMDNENVSVQFEELPEYFALRAVLEDAEGVPLCQPVLWLERLDPYQQFEEKQPGDFAGGRVLDYGGKGFAVLRDHVREVRGSESGGVYTVQCEEEIYDWDALYIADLNVLVRARNVNSRGEGVYTLTADGDTSLSDFFQYIRYHADLDPVPSLQGTEYAGGILQGRGTADLARFTAKYTLGGVTAQATLGTSITCDLTYDAALFGDYYMACDLYAEADAGITLTATREYTYEKEWPLFLTTVPTDIPGLLITLDATLPVELSAKAEATASAQVSARLGFRYSSDSGYTQIQEGEATWDLSAKAELSAKAGPKFAIGLSFMRVVTASVSAQAGLEVTAEASREAHSGEGSPDSCHACTLCFDVAVNKFVTLDAGLYALGETLAEHNLYDYSEPIFAGYLSVVNDEESPLGGKVTLAEGECPNIKYRTNLRVHDPDDPGTVKYAAVHRRVNVVERALVQEGWAPLQVYLYPGSYVAESDHLGHAEYMNFEIEDEPLDLLMDFTLIPIDADHFPNAHFRQFVAENFDKDGDMQLNAWERCRVTKIEYFPQYLEYVTQTPIEKASYEGLQYFSELKTLFMDHWMEISDGLTFTIENIDLSQNTKLEEVTLWCMPENCVNISGCENLRDLKLLGSRVTEVDVSSCPLLENLEIGNHYNGLELVVTEGNENLKQLDVSHNPALKNLRVEGCLNLTRLIMGSHPNLENISLYACGLSSINLSGCPAVKWLNVKQNHFTYLDLSECSRIDELNIRLNPGLTVNLRQRYSIWASVPGEYHAMVFTSPNQTVYFNDTTLTVDSDGMEHWSNYN